MAKYVVMLTIDVDDEDFDIDYACSIANSLIHLGNIEIDGTRQISVRPLSEEVSC